jgi:pyridoxal phosphate enzyme (YggS family)
VPVERILQAYEAGLRHFGENRVQEALPKLESLPMDIHWHLVGRLQTNKINKILGKFELIQSVDTPDLARAIASRLAGRRQEILLEVNTSGEGSKAGVGPEKAVAVAREVSAIQGLVLRGLMTVGPLALDRILRRDAFKRLKDLFDAVRAASFAGEGFDILSMGMSSDFEDAVELGSTHVRIGTALFGERA